MDALSLRSDVSSVKILSIVPSLGTPASDPSDPSDPITCFTALESTQGQIDGFFSQLPYKCHQNRVASVGD